MKKENNYLKNTIILLIGKFSTQIISFMLLPLYTYKLSTDNYGYIDLLQTYISLFSPILMLQLDSAIFRFLIDVREQNEEKNKIISSSFICLVIILLISSIIFFIINFFVKINYSILILLNVISLVYNTFCMSITRGNGHNRNYSISSIITAIITLVINVMLILILNYDAKSILISSIFANFISSIYLSYKEKVFYAIKKNCFEKNILKKLLKYSIPMIPNSLSWWIVGLSDRTLISIIIGVSANGIYSVSSKFSNLLNSIFSIFSMSWQETASMHIKDKDSNLFFSKMIINIYNFFIVLSCLIISILPLIFNIIIGKEYIESYAYIPIILLSNVFNVLAGLLGGIYVAKKMTNKVAYTTIASAIINIVINILFIRKFGLYAASFSTLIAYFLMLIYRYFDVKNIMNIKLKWRKNILYFITFIISIILYYINNSFLCCFSVIFVVIVYIWDNKNFLKEIMVHLKMKHNI